MNLARRPTPRNDRLRSGVPNPDVLAVRVADELEKQALLGLDPEVFFTEPHYNGYPAVLVRIPAIDVGLLETVLADAWRTRAPKARLAELSGTRESGRDDR